MTQSTSEEPSGQIPPLQVAAADAPSGGGAAAEHALPVTRSARYYTLGAAGGDVRELWYVLHGYGQLAAYFVRPFAGLDNTHRLIVAPEALSRFYLDDAHRRVGASWMTRADRQREIDDYLAYLNALHARIAGELADDVQVHVLGFSQGSETAARWTVFGAAAVYRLVLWGGRLPADLDLAAHRDVLCRARLTLVRGGEDTYATAERMEEEEGRLNRHLVPYHAITFEGGHRLDVDVLHALAAG